MDISNEPLNLCTKNSSDEQQEVHREHIIDYDDACLPKNCDKKLNGGTSPTPDESELDTESSAPFNPNLLLQQHQLEQYLLLQQQQQVQQHMIDGTQAKMHLDKYLKLTNRYLNTMSPFLQHFQQGPVVNAQAAANAAATLLLANHQSTSGDRVDDGDDSCDGSMTSSSTQQQQDGVRLFLHKLIEYNFLQQLQQQQQINDLINNNNNNNNNQSNNKNGSHSNHNNNTNGHNHSKANKSPTNSNDGDSDYYNHHNIMPTPTSATKTFFDFLKNASAANSGTTSGQQSGSSNGHNSRIQAFKRSSSENSKNTSSSISSENMKTSEADKKKPHIKKPLNAFMLYMKEMRAQVVAECTLKESAAINQILGRKWHALGREEQAKYYELARRERQLHMQMYPDWSSRTNATRGKKRKRKQEPTDGGTQK
ncbi:hypothetical protein PVAND_014923 [Polypedilum vanderplanki]|uniref:dTCF n=1 Tax=Polypedilum vanderplanki TaxID=319348 RepID=A0A9J6BAR7_POLVA|nr:hypothetical protein PVAND_014923 [Polypedilum vanderplanki]